MFHKNLEKSFNLQEPKKEMITEAGLLHVKAVKRAAVLPYSPDYFEEPKELRRFSRKKLSRELDRDQLETPI